MRALLLTAALAAATASPAFATNLLTNGGFEAPVIGGFYANDPESISVTGWTADNVDIVSAPFAGGAPAAEGIQYLDLVGYGTSGSISQSFATTVGQQYTFSFAYSNNPFGGPASHSAAVLINGVALSSSIAHSSATTGNLDWQNFSTTFTAVSTTSSIGFASQLATGNAGILLDAVSVSAVPEPATWGLLILGFGVVGGTLRRRQSVRVTYA